MKHSSKGVKRQNNQETSYLLKAIRSLIKVERYRQEASQILDDLDSGGMNPENKVEYLYVSGRYHYYMYKQHEDMEALDWANDYLDEMATYAYEHKIPTGPSMVYTRAFVKFKLAELVWDEDRKPWLLKKARHITDTSLKFDPKNSSFQWLKTQLDK